VCLAESIPSDQALMIRGFEKVICLY